MVLRIALLVLAIPPLMASIAGCQSEGRIYVSSSWRQLWTAGDSAPAPRRDGAIFVYDNNIYIYGGYWDERRDGGWIGRKANDLWKLIRATEKWDEVRLTNRPHPVYTPGAIWTGKYLYVAGGRYYPKDGGKIEGYPFLWRYGPAEAQWINLGKAEGPLLRMEHNMHWTGSMVLLYGGNTLENESLHDIWKYYPITNIWVKIEALGECPDFDRWPRDQIIGTAWSNSEMIVLGSSYQEGFDNIWAFNPEMRTWRYLPPPKIRPPFRAGPVVATGRDGSIYVFGGYRGGELGGWAKDWLNDLWAFDPARNIWTEIRGRGDPPSPRMATGIIDGNSLYIFGGIGPGKKYFNDLWCLGLDGESGGGAFERSKLAVKSRLPYRGGERWSYTQETQASFMERIFAPESNDPWQKYCISSDLELSIMKCDTNEIEVEIIPRRYHMDLGDVTWDYGTEGLKVSDENIRGIGITGPFRASVAADGSSVDLLIDPESKPFAAMLIEPLRAGAVSLLGGFSLAGVKEGPATIQDATPIPLLIARHDVMPLRLRGTISKEAGSIRELHAVAELDREACEYPWKDKFLEKGEAIMQWDLEKGSLKVHIAWSAETNDHLPLASYTRTICIKKR